MNQISKIAKKLAWYSLFFGMALILVVLHYDNRASGQAAEFCNSIKIGESVGSVKDKFNQTQAVKNVPQLSSNEIVAVFKGATPEHICTITTKNGQVTTKKLTHTNP